MKNYIIIISLFIASCGPDVEVTQLDPNTVIGDLQRGLHNVVLREKVLLNEKKQLKKSVSALKAELKKCALDSNEYYQEPTYSIWGN